MAVNVQPQPGRPHEAASRYAVVAQAEAYLRAHIDAVVPVAELGRFVGLSERGIRNAFYDVHAMSPKRWMLVERLREARRELREGDIKPTTVTSVATHYGFYELGRFAGTYKRVFGEAPSETLRKTRRTRHASGKLRSAVQ